MTSPQQAFRARRASELRRRALSALDTIRAREREMAAGQDYNRARHTSWRVRNVLARITGEMIDNGIPPGEHEGRWICPWCAGDNRERCERRRCAQRYRAREDVAA